MTRFNKKNNKGVALFVAVLITSVALLFSYAVSNIAVKELNLTQAGRDSQIAFYASNSGIECALFWDLRNNSFDPNNASNSFVITCADQDVSVTAPGSGLPRTFTSEAFNLNNDPNGPCFTFTILKEDEDGDIVTQTESRGYNTCNVGSSRRLERALRATY
ncbi:MAG: hypothetical protein AAB534_02690 [Patescibacteria group bacterium]